MSSGPGPSLKHKSDAPARGAGPHVMRPMPLLYNAVVVEFTVFFFCYLLF
jgi:hypothetical protein